MRIIDRIALNRLIILVGNFILAIIKIFVPEKTQDDVDTKPERKKILPWRNRKKS